MKIKNTGWLIASLVIFTILVLPAIGTAALPFTLKSGHPRVYLDQARIDNVLKPTAQAQLPFYGSNFPQTAGTLTFDLYVPPPPVDSNGNLKYYEGTPIFDSYDSTRNHIFVGHRDSDNTKINGVLNKVAISIAFQNKTSDPFGYWVVYLTPNTWHTVAIHWNSTTPSLNAEIDAGTSQAIAWSVNQALIPMGWTPSDQKFVFTGRENRLDNIKLYASDTANPASLVASYPLDEGSNVYAADVSGHGHAARLGSNVVWTTRSASDAKPCIQINGGSAVFTVIADSPLTDSWLPTYRSAQRMASILNKPGGTINDVNTEQGGGITEHARVLGLAYLVTGDPQFKTALLRYADQILTVTPTVDVKGNISYPGGDDSQSGRVEALGIIYDWLYNSVTTEQRPGTGGLYSNAIAQHIKGEISAYNLSLAVCGGGNTLAADWTCVTASNPPTPVQPRPSIGGHSHFNDAYISAAVIAIIDEHPELQNLLDILYYDFANVFNPALAWYSVDGGHAYGWSYGATYTLLDPILLWQNAGAPMAAPWQSNLIYRYIYGLRGDLHYPASGDNYHIGLADERVAAQALWAAVRSGDRHAEYYFDRWIKPHLGNGSVSVLFFSQPSAQPQPQSVSDLPYSRLYRNTGQVLMRDTWDYLNATLLEFKSTSFWTENHEHLDQNVFTIFYKAPLLVDSGYFDAYGSDHWRNYYTRTIAHNSITVWDPTETYSSYNYAKYTYSNDGGQNTMPVLYPTLAQMQEGGSNHIDGVVAYQYEPGFTYTVGNASKAYKSTKLDQANGFLRSIVFLRQPSFWPHPVTVVFDKVTAVPGKAGLIKRFLLHSATEPEPFTGPGITTVAGNTLTIRNGGGILFSQTLLPENPVLTKIGGGDSSNPTTDYRFRVPMCTASACQTNGNYMSTLTNFAPDPALVNPSNPSSGLQTIEADPDKGAWRIEVTAPAPSQREYFLHVLSIADNGAAKAPPNAQSLSSDSAAVALLADTLLVAFNKGDQPASSLSWNMPVNDLKMIVTGLLPSTAYSGAIVSNGPGNFSVNLHQDQNGQLVTSSQGVLTVNSSLSSFGTHLIGKRVPESGVRMHTIVTR